MRIERAREAVLARLLRSRAWKKHESGDVIVFREACAFWGIIPRSANEEYRFARMELDDSLGRRGSPNSASRMEPDLFVPEANRVRRPGDARGICGSWTSRLTETFTDELSGITGRVIDRGRVRQRVGYWVVTTVLHSILRSIRRRPTRTTSRCRANGSARRSSM